MNLIQHRLTDKPRFFLLRDVPEKREYCFTFSRQYPCDGNNEGAEKEGYCKCYEYMEQLELCEEKALEIVNPDVSGIKWVIRIPTETVWASPDGNLLKHNDTFPLPDDVEFKEGWHDWNEGVKVIRLSKKEEKEDKEEENANKLLAALSNKEESQEELINYFIIMYLECRNNFLDANHELKKHFTIQRKHYG